MDRREIVKRAFHFERPTRVPFVGLTAQSDFYPIGPNEPNTWQPTNYPPHPIGGDVEISNPVFRRDIYDWDDKIRKNLGYSENWWETPHDCIDEFSVIWRSSGTKGGDWTKGHPHKGPFQDSGTGEGWDNFDSFKFPDPDDPLRYMLVKKGRWKAIAEDRYLLGTINSSGIFNRCSQLRGFSELLIDLARNRRPMYLSKLINAVTDYNLGVIQQLKNHCPLLDSMFLTDDFGTQKSAFISPRIFKKHFKDSYKKIVKLTHDLGMDFILHSCGDVLGLLPEFIDVGIDVMEFDSPHMTGVENFKQFASERKIAFWLSSNIQSTFINGTPKDVEEEIKYYIKEIGNNEGGLAIYEYTDYEAINAPRKNIRAQRKAVAKWGNYNENGIIDWLAE
ncbi:MAG: uroporphyrinogen decarboxylase family protein [Candidatus Hermodarchaeota archaeon]